MTTGDTENTWVGTARLLLVVSTWLALFLATGCGPSRPTDRAMPTAGRPAASVPAVADGKTPDQSAPALPATWSAQADPRPLAADARPFSLPIRPGARVARQVETPLVLVESVGPDPEWQLVDLTEGKVSGSIRTRDAMLAKAVSPDGKRLAAVLHKPGPAWIRFWSFATGRSTGDMVLGNDRGAGPITWLRFATTDLLVAMRNGTRGPEALLIDFNAQGSAQLPRPMRLAAPSSSRDLSAVGISPGGRYLAAIVGDHLIVHDLRSLACVGGVEMLTAEDMELSLRCKELVFSPDGAFIATLYGLAGQPELQLRVWDFASGKLVESAGWRDERWRMQSDPVSGERPLEWLPDGSGWIVGNEAIWRRGAPSPEPPMQMPADTQLVFPIDSNQILAFHGTKADDYRLALMPIDGPAPPRTAFSPTTTPADVRQWSVVVDGTDFRWQVPSRPFTMLGRLPLAPRFPQRPGPYGACAVGPEYVVFEIGSGQEIKRFAGGETMYPVWDISPDGQRLATGQRPVAGEPFRFAIWQTATGEELFRGAVDAKGVDLRLEFLDAKRILCSSTVDGQRRQHLIWSLPSGEKLVDVVSASDLGAYVHNSHVVTPGGRYVVSMFQDTLIAWDLADGQQAGKAQVPLGTGRQFPREVASQALTLDGERLYVLLRYHDDSLRLVSFAMDSGLLITTQSLDIKQFLAAAGNIAGLRATPRQVPWIVDDSCSLIFSTAAMRVSDGDIQGPIDVSPDATLIASSGGQLTFGQIEPTQAHLPAVVVATLNSRQSARLLTGQLLASIRESNSVASTAAARTEPRPASPDTPAADGTPPERPANVVASTMAWTSCVDPLAESETLTPAREVSVDVPTRARLITAERTGRYIGVIDEEANQGRLLDLTTGTLGTATFPAPKRADWLVAIDARGEHVACQSASNQIVIHSLDDGSSATVGREGSFVNVRWLGFDSRGKLVAAFQLSGDSIEVLAWPTDGGEPLYRLTSPPVAAFAMSPGGNWLALLRRDGLNMIDLTDGRQRQSTPIPFTRFEGPLPFQCYGMQISPDGRELAAEHSTLQDSCLTIWDLESGRPVLHRPIRGGAGTYSLHTSDLAPPLAWLPGQPLLIRGGSLLIDRPTGTRFWLLSQRDWESVLPLANQTMLVVRRDGDAPRLSRVPLPRQEMAAAVAVVRRLPSENLPRLTPIDPAEPTDAASATAPDSDLDAITPRRLAAAPHILDDDELFTAPHRITATTAEANRLVIQRVTDYTNTGARLILEGPLRPERTCFLDTLDAATGKRLHRLEVPARSELLDVSPDGTLALTGDDLWSGSEGRGYSRLDIWSLPTSRHAAGWEPVPSSSALAHCARWGAFMDKTHVLVLAGSELTCWKLPDCRRVYSLSCDGPPAISPQRDRLVTRKGSELALRVAASGAVLRTLASPFGEQPTDGKASCTFSPDGMHIIGVIPRQQHHAVVRWDAGNGQVARQFAIPPVPYANCVAIEDRGLMLPAHERVAAFGAWLVDLEQQQLATQFKGANGIHGGAPDGTYWRSEHTSVATNKGAYVVRMFGADAFDWPTGAAPPVYQIWGRGSRVAIDLRCSLPEAGALRTELQNKVESLGLVVDNAANVRVTLQVEAFDKTIRSGRTRDLVVPSYRCHLAGVDASGTVAWQRQLEMARNGTPEPLTWLRHERLPAALFRANWQDHFPTQPPMSLIP